MKKFSKLMAGLCAVTVLTGSIGCNSISVFAEEGSQQESAAVENEIKWEVIPVSDNNDSGSDTNNDSSSDNSGAQEASAPAVEESAPVIEAAPSTETAAADAAVLTEAPVLSEDQTVDVQTPADGNEILSDEAALLDESAAADITAVPGTDEIPAVSAPGADTGITPEALDAAGNEDTSEEADVQTQEAPALLSAPAPEAKEAPAEAPAAEPEEKEDELILNRPEQSDEVISEAGDPKGTKNENLDSNLPEGYDLLLGEDGVFRLTYTIAEDCDAEKIYIDLNKAMEMAKKYAGMTDSTWLQPGDTRIVQVYIESESGHTYKYADGSFTLTTADLNTNQTQKKDETGEPIIEDPQEGDVVGFDKQVLDDDHKGNDSFGLSIRTEPMITLLHDALGISESDIRQGWVKTITYDQALELSSYLGKNYGEDDLEDGIKAYLMSYYSDLDGADYTDFLEMMKTSQTANDELYSDTSTNQIFAVDSKSITNQNVAAGLMTKLNASTDLDMMKALAAQKTGNDYSKCTSLSKLKTQLHNEGNTELADLIPSSTSISKTVPAILKMYEAVNGEGTAYKDFLESKGYNADDFEINPKITFDSSYDTKALASTEKTFEYPLDPAVRYNNFYQNLLSVLVAGSKEEVDAVTGGESGIVQTVTKYVYKVVDADDGKVYEGCVPANQLGIYYINIMKKNGLPVNTLVKVLDDGTFIFGFGTEEGGIATADKYDGEITDTYVSSMQEYNNASWSSDNLAPQLADYMTKSGSLSRDMSAWKNANALFNKLLGEGITAGQAAITAFMAYNIDGRLTGNDYQDTEWSWASSIALERIDGELKINKVETEGEAEELSQEELKKCDRITNSEAQFALWQIKEETSSNGEKTSKKYYLQQKTKDGNTVYSWVEATDDSMVVTISTKNGMIDIDYKLLENMVYYLQEKVAPKGHKLDAKVYVICDEDEYDNACEKLGEGENGEKPNCVYAGAINSEKPLEIYVGNEVAYGDLKIEKVDEKKELISDSETGFALWKYEDEDTDDGNKVTKKYYLQQSTKDGSVVYGWVEATDENMKIYITTQNGVLEINDTLIMNMVYYLQETVAPEGYELDTTVYVICDDGDFEAACAKLGEGAKTKHLGAIDSENALEVEIVNKPKPHEGPKPEGGGEGGDSEPPTPTTSYSFEVPNVPQTVKSEINLSTPSVPRSMKLAAPSIPRNVATGDESDALRWLIVFLASFGGLVAWLVNRSKKNYQ